jgi:hypothetical protein
MIQFGESFSVVSLPLPAPEDLEADDVNFEPAPNAIDPDPACSGSVNAPTAPAGKACFYIGSFSGVGGPTLEGRELIGTDGRRGLVVRSQDPTPGNPPEQTVFGTWAYTAP